ncbi:YqgE/AlgH family protein [Chlamydia sp. 17-3921]|uniref:YqgE/AlgH family protein n=1 Tax=Chlamydia sp. 17-3921 TaxID=2675798 RepID=UPI00191AD084|nr:YqgE/AlgH family protein [Chlamydia sp. 17-3921]
MVKIPYTQIEKGSLLIASPDMDQGVFARSVILLCEHSLNGSFGLILNKTLGFEISDDIFSFEKTTNDNIRFCMGGPLQANQMMLLHSFSEIPDQTIEICSSVFLGGDLPFLQDAASSDKGTKVNLCFGYSGWQAGQLEREFLDGIWFLTPGCREYVFSSDPENLWSLVLRDMRGKYASLSTVPENLFLN